MCIKANRNRYSYGRQANRTLRGIPIPSPEEIPAWVREDSVRVIDEMVQGLRSIDLAARV
jgi:hypothetical protein